MGDLGAGGGGEDGAGDGADESSDAGEVISVLRRFLVLYSCTVMP